MNNPFLNALLHPLNLAMLALSVAAGLCAAWWLFPLGLIVLVLMVFMVMRDPYHKINQVMHSRAPLAPRFQASFGQIERQQLGIYNAMSAARPGIRRMLRPLQEDVNALTDQAFDLCQRSSALENYRVVSIARSRGNTEDEWIELSKKAAATTDPILQREYNQSINALEARLANQRQSAARLDRIDAQLLGLSTVLESILAEILRLQSLGEAALKESLPGMRARLGEEAAELSVLGSDLREQSVA